MIKVVTYLNLNGTGTAAMNFYQSIFGGELKIQSYKDTGQAESEAENDLLMHGELVTEGMNLFASDGNEKHKVTMGDSVQLCLVGEDEHQLREYFDKLAEGGTIDMPLMKQFWGDIYGMLTDKYGIHWMVNISAQK